PTSPTLFPYTTLFRSAVHGPDGPRSDLAAVIRPAPHRIAGDRIVPLAALAEPCPATGRPIAAALAGEDLDRWWTALLEAVLAPRSEEHTSELQSRENL